MGQGRDKQMSISWNYICVKARLTSASIIVLDQVPFTILEKGVAIGRQASQICPNRASWVKVLRMYNKAWGSLVHFPTALFLLVFPCPFSSLLTQILASCCLNILVLISQFLMPRHFTGSTILDASFLIKTMICKQTSWTLEMAFLGLRYLAMSLLDD